jgi:hypothetical protein
MSQLKRRIHKFNFKSTETGDFAPHVALVDHAANNLEVLTLKAASQPEVQVSLTMREFLDKFFYIYGESASVLAGILGFDTGATEQVADTYEEYIQDKVNSVVLLKGKVLPENLPQKLADEISGLQSKFGDTVEETYKSLVSTSKEKGGDVTLPVTPNPKEIPMDTIETLKAKLDAQAVQLEEVSTLKSQLADLQTLSADKAKIEMTTCVKGYSFVTEENQESLVTSLLTLKGDTLSTVIASLESAREAVTATALTEQGTVAVDDATPAEGEETFAEKANSHVASILAARNS